MKLFSAAGLALFAATSAFANTTVTLDFEGAPGYVNSIGEFYNGGTDSVGQSGPNYGVSFTEAAVTVSNDDFFQYYSGAPSPISVMTALDSSAVMNVASGFVDRLTFYYSASQGVLDAVNIYSGLNGTGTLLASVSLFGNAQVGCSDLPYCRFDLTSVKFAGVGQSISFGGGAPDMAFDDITITAVPEPSTYLMLAAGLLAVAAVKRRRDA